MVPPVPGVVVAYTVMPMFCSMLGGIGRVGGVEELEGVGRVVIGVLVGVDG